MEKKFCAKCEVEKELKYFGKNSKLKDGLTSECKTCRNQKHRENYKKKINERRAKRRKSDVHRRENIRVYVDKIKKTLMCERCEENNYLCLTFHHIDPKSKEIEIAKITNWSIKKFETERKKCIVLCANCHIKEHANMRYRNK